MNKEEALDTIETNIEANESNAPFLKVLILIFLITDITWAIFFILSIIQLTFSGFLMVAVCLIVTTSLLCWMINLFNENREETIIFKKAKWIVTYWLDSKYNFDKSFFKYNYPSDNNKEAIEYISKLMEKHSKEYAWDDN